MVSIALMNNKGGAGKTTTALNLAYKLAEKGLTLLIDADPQANASMTFEVTDPKYSILDAFLGKKFETIKVREQLDLLPATFELSGLDDLLSTKRFRETILKKALKNHIELYDYIVVDCPPSIGIGTINILSFVQHVVIPIKSEIFSIHGLSNMIEICQEIKEEINTDLNVLGILITQHNERLNLSKNILEDIKKLGWDIALFDAKIRSTTDVPTSQYLKQTIFEHKKTSTASIDYNAFVEELLYNI